MVASSVRFGPGVTREVGMDLAALNVRRVLVVADRAVSRLPAGHVLLESLGDQPIAHALFDRGRREPSHVSFQDAISSAQQVEFDAVVAIGGGSAIDTAK